MAYMTYIAMSHVFSPVRHVSNVSHHLISHVLKYIVTYMTYIVLKACGLM
jgi:hypothetical protein